MYGGRGNGGKLGAEVGASAFGAIHAEGFCLVVVGQHYLFALVVAQRHCGAAFHVQHHLASLAQYLGAFLGAGGSYFGRGCYAAVGFALIFVQVEVASNAVGRAILQCGHLVSILPVAHPGDGYVSAVGGVVKGYGGVVVFAIVHPFCNLGLRLAGKLASVEIAYKVLCGRAAGGAARVDVAYQQPLFFVGAAHGQLHQVGALPYAAVVAISLTKRTFILPRLEVGRRVDLHFLSGSQDEAPLAQLLVPEHVRVAEVGHIARDNGVALIFLKRLAVVGAVGQTLCLVLASRCIHGHDGASAKTRCIILIYYGRT